MGTFLVFILKSSVCLTLFYLLYKLVFSKATFHKANRFVLIGLYALALVLPSVDIKTDQPADFHYTIQQWQETLLLPAHENTVEVTTPSYAGTTGTEKITPTISWTDIVLWIYCCGILFFFFRSLYSFFRMSILLRNAKCEKLYGNIKLVTHTKNIAPFSWMNYIVLSESDRKESGEVIITHEFAHIRYHHSLDLFISEMFTLLQWFNPAAWLMKRELQNVHEYQADEKVLEMGVGAKEYQLLLIKKAVGSQRFNSMTHSFNHSKLKNRITMMLKPKSSSWAGLRYLLILPLAALSVAVFARPEVVEKMEELSVVRITSETPVVEDVVEEKQDTVVVPPKAAEKKLPYQNLNREQLLEIIKERDVMDYERLINHPQELTNDLLRYDIVSHALYHNMLKSKEWQDFVKSGTKVNNSVEYKIFTEEWNKRQKQRNEEDPNPEMEDHWKGFLEYTKNNEISEELKAGLIELQENSIKLEKSKEKQEYIEFMNYWSAVSGPNLTTAEPRN